MKRFHYFSLILLPIIMCTSLYSMFTATTRRTATSGIRRPFFFPGVRTPSTTRVIVSPQLPTQTVGVRQYSFQPPKTQFPQEEIPSGGIFERFQQWWKGKTENDIIE